MYALQTVPSTEPDTQENVLKISFLLHDLNISQYIHGCVRVKMSDQAEERPPSSPTACHLPPQPCIRSGTQRMCPTSQRGSFSWVPITQAHVFILTGMAYDRYVAICKPLLYTLIMTRQKCVAMIAACCAGGFLRSFGQFLLAIFLPYCGPCVSFAEIGLH